MGFSFETRSADTDESFPDHLGGSDVAEFLARTKAEAFAGRLKPNEILITADTIVCQDDNIFNKPENRGEALQMLRALNAKEHTVISGVCLCLGKNYRVFHDSTQVHFDALETTEMEYYIDRFKPYDKAGAYGIQEWMGLVGIRCIEGSFYNVMGFPTHMFYKELKQFIAQL